MSPARHLTLLTAAVCCSAMSTIKGDLYDAVGKPLLDLQNQFRMDLLWCGVRDVAPFPEAISAVYPNLDSCCRMHDLCPVIIDRGECKDNVCNHSFIFPILACECEQLFRRCLKSVANYDEKPFIQHPVSWTERLLSDTFGVGYFRLFPAISDRKCVKKARPVLPCGTNNITGAIRICGENEGEQGEWELHRVKDIIAREGLVLYR